MHLESQLLFSEMSSERKKKGRPRIYSDVAEITNKKSVVAWLNNLREGPSRKAAGYSIARFLRWRKIDPDSLIEECLNGTNRTLIEHVKAALDYCQSDNFKGSSLSTREKHYNNIRSFYSGNMVTLPKVKLKVGEVENSKVGIETTASEYLKMAEKALLVASVRDRSIILTALQSAMDDSTLAEVFNVIGYPQLVKHFGSKEPKLWNSAKCPVRIILKRPKSNYRYYTFLDVDAIEALKIWLAIRGTIRIYSSMNPALLDTSDPIYTKQGGFAINSGLVSTIFRKAGKRAGVNIRNHEPNMQELKGSSIRYPFHSHEVRDTLITLARRVKADTAAANFFAGHSIDKLKYDKSPWDSPDFFSAQYLKLARPHLNLVSGKALLVEEDLRKSYDERLSSLEKKLEAALASQAAS